LIPSRQDIFGWELPVSSNISRRHVWLTKSQQNVRLVADEYAKQGNYRVLVPDFFGNDAVDSKHMSVLAPLESDKSMSDEERGAAMGKIFPGEIQPWLGRQSDDKMKPLFEKLFSTLREQKVEKIGEFAPLFGTWS
jgi:hypothetical protein